MTAEDWQFLAFMSIFLWVLVPTFAALTRYSDLTRYEDRAGNVSHRDLTPHQARLLIWRYSWVSVLVILWPLTFIGAVLWAIGWVLWKAGGVVRLAMTRG